MMRSSNAEEPVPNPAVSAPPGGGRGQPFGALTAPHLAQARYTEAEYFFAGTATAYEKDGAWGLDGAWRVRPGKTAGYKVGRPAVRWAIQRRRRR